MSDLPYTRDVLRLAAEANGAGRLRAPDGTHVAHNPTCGDRTTVDLAVGDGRITAMAHETKACVLTQASASILAASLPGRPPADLVALRAEVAAMLKDGPPPAAPFATFAVLRDVARFPSRHTCVLLPIDAALKALEDSQAPKPGRQGTEV